MNKTKVSVIGAGNMGFNHARVFESIGNLEYVIERNPERREFLKRIYGDSRVVDSVLKTDSDAYVIATPTASHFDIAKSLLKKNKHLLIEKPVCMKVWMADELTSIAENSDVKIAIGHVERFNPVVNYLTTWISQKSLKTLETYRLSALPPQVKDIGVFKDLGIHDVDIVLSMVNSPLHSVYALSSEKDGKDLYTKASLQFDNGVCAFITTSWLSTSKTRKLYVSTEYEDAEIDYLKQTFETKRVNIPAGSSFQPQSYHNIEKIELKKVEPLLLQAKDFISSIENGHDPCVSLDQGSRALKVVEQILVSAKEKRVIKF
jgi:predicted dehydrogenase